MPDLKKKVGILIHSFAVAHALAAGLLAQTVVGDTVVLTVLTISMIFAISQMCGQRWNIGKVLAQIGVYIGGYLGGYGAAFLYKWIPGVGNFANALTTTVITEALGWATYLVCTRGKDPSTMTEKEKKDISKEAKKMQRDEHDNIKQDYNALSQEDRDRLKEITDELCQLRIDENNPDDESVERISKLTEEMNNILSKQ